LAQRGARRDPTPTVVPRLAYEDGPGAMDSLVQAFGFREQMRSLDVQPAHSLTATRFRGACKPHGGG
jgi:hypothetical protein